MERARIELTKSARPAAASPGPIDGRDEEFPGGIARLGLGSAEGEARQVGGIVRFNLARRG
jgi:hypothetical protein